MHVRKATAFTEKEIQFLSHFPLITFEKTTGAKEFGSTEKGTLRAAEAVKKINPRAKILYYRNIIVHYAAYDVDASMEQIPGALLIDATGNTKLIRGRVSAYDLSNRALQEWWLAHVEAYCRSAYIDGLFIDGNIKVLEPAFLRQELGAEKKAAVERGYHRMMSGIHETLGPNKLVIANIIRARFPDAGVGYADYFDGSYIEGFEHAVGGLSREEYMAKGIAGIQTAARSGKIIAFTMGMGEIKATKMGIDEARGEILDQAALQKRLVYALANFLVCAEKYSYFLPHDGYGVDSGESLLWMKDIPEFNRPLGAPKGAAVKSGWIYTREFEHARVWLDLESEKAEVIWN